MSQRCAAFSAGLQETDTHLLLMCVFDGVFLSNEETGLPVTAPTTGYLAIEWYESFGLPVTIQECWVAVLINHEGFILVPT